MYLKLVIIFLCLVNVALGIKGIMLCYKNDKIIKKLLEEKEDKNEIQ